MLTNLIAVGLLVFSGTAYAGTGKNCGDFTYREDAQAYFDEQGYSGGNDPEGLDREGDGKACENRPSRPDDEPSRDDSDAESGDADDDEPSRDDESDSDDSDDEDSDDAERPSGSQVTIFPRGSVAAGG